MDLKYVKTEKCPICGCSVIVSEYVDNNGNEIRKHTNGQIWETRYFLCGYITRYNPCFSAEEVVSHCSRNPEIIERRNKIKKFAENMEEILKSADVDDHVKDRVLSTVRYLAE